MFYEENIFSQMDSIKVTRTLMCPIKQHVTDYIT